MPRAQEGVCLRLILNRGRADSKARDHCLGTDRSQDMESVKIAKSAAASLVGVLGQPADTTAIAPASGDADTIDDFIGAVSAVELLCQIVAKSDNRSLVLSHESVELAVDGQMGEQVPET